MFFQKIIFISFFLFSCICAASDPDYSSMGAGFFEPSMKRSPAAMTPMAVEGIVDSNYRLGPGDFLDLMLEGQYLTVQVYSDGTVAIEECGVVDVAGKTIAQAREEILKLAAKKYNVAYCFVQFSQMKKFVVNIMGAVPKVGQTIVDPQTRLSMLLQKAGGILGSGRKDDVLVIRNGDTTHVNCFDIFDKGDFEQDILLEQGDRIYVPFVNSSEMVALIFPSGRLGIPYDSAFTIAQYYERAGGDRMHNAGYQSLTIRYPDKSTKTITVKEMDQWKVPPQSEIEFSIKTLFVYVGGAVAAMGKIPYESSWHAIDYIAAAGIATQTGSWSQVTVVRGDDQQKIKLNVSVDQIIPGDYIEIPKSRYENFKDVTLFLASLLSVISTAVVIYSTFH